MSSPHVLVVSTKVDIATDAVMRLLNARGASVTRLNTEDFPYDSFLTTTLSNQIGTVRADFRSPPGSRSNLNGTSAIWYRRVRSAEPLMDMPLGVHDFCIRES